MWCYVIIFCSISFPSRGCRNWALRSDFKLTKLILRVGCTSYNISSYRKSALIYNPSAQIPKALNQRDTAGKTIKYLGTNTLI